MRKLVIRMDKELEMRGWEPGMKKRKLNYRFHNINTVEATATYLLKVLLEANTVKVEQAIQEAERVWEKEGHST